MESGGVVHLIRPAYGALGDADAGATRTADVDAEAAGPFGLLPDELVRQIFEYVGPVDAYEHARLGEVCRRFRGLLPGVVFQELDMMSDMGPERFFDEYVDRGRRMLARLRRGLLAGARRASIVLPSPRSPREYLEQSGPLLDLLAALAASPAGLEAAEVGQCGGEWPASDSMLAGAAAAVLDSLAPAAGLRSLSLAADLAQIACRLPGRLARLAPLAELRARVPGAWSGEEVRPLSPADAAALASAFPRLRRASLLASEPAALAALAPLALEELEATLYSDAGAGGALAVLAGGPSAASLRALDLRSASRGPLLVPPAGLAAACRLHALQSLSLAVGPACDLRGLAHLPALRSLVLRLDLSGRPDGGAAAMRAAAAALPALPPDLTLDLELTSGFGPLDDGDARVVFYPLSGPPLAALLAAAHPHLRDLAVRTLRPYPGEMEALGRLAGRPGPRLRRLRHTTEAGMPGTWPSEPYCALAATLPAEEPPCRVELKLAVQARAAANTRLALGAMLPGYVDARVAAIADPRRL